jgi:AraC-like DNA-binding protein
MHSEACGKMQHYAAKWEGLTSQVFECVGWKITNDLELPHSVLLLHQEGQRSIGVRTSGSSWKFVARKGRFDYFPAGKYDAIVSGPTPIRGIKVEIPAAFENSVLEEGRWDAELSPRFQFQDRRLEGLVQSLVKAAGKRLAPPDAVLLSVAVVDRLYETAALSTAAARHSVFTNTVRRLIVEYVDQYLGSSIDVDKVAFLTGLARTQFGKVFRESFGLPLHQYVLARKIHVATRRLLDDVRVTELSQELGFSSHAHFSTVFRHYVGTTPSEFRKHRAIPAKAVPG